MIQSTGRPVMKLQWQTWLIPGGRSCPGKVLKDNRYPNVGILQGGAQVRDR